MIIPTHDQKDAAIFAFENPSPGATIDKQFAPMRIACFPDFMIEDREFFRTADGFDQTTTPNGTPVVAVYFGKKTRIYDLHGRCRIAFEDEMSFGEALEVI